MSGARPFQGSLFAEDFLLGSIKTLPDWETVTDAALDEVHAQLRILFTRFPAAASPNESQTEDDLIWPVLQTLGWSASLRQQNLSARGRENVPDGLLFEDDAAKDHANSFFEEWKRYEFGLAIVESKRWARLLDRRSGKRGEETAPSTQMLRYLRRVDDLSEGGVRWGILTNGQYWRLYWQGALSVSEQFFEIDLAAVLDLPGHNDGLFVLDAVERRHWLKVFVLAFGRNAFLPDPADGRTFHRRAIDEARFYQQRVSTSLSELVFDKVFPALAHAIAEAAPDAPLDEVREATLVLLYRLLFILYAEDRDLLPVRDTRYDDYGVRDKVRGDVGRRKDQGDVFSRMASRYWSAFDDLCRAIDVGDTSIGLPPYNGGLFDRQRTPLLRSIRLGDAVMAEVIDALSFEQAREGRRYINYRDLGVQQLGSIYERLLEQEIVRDGDTLTVRPNIFAQKNTGSYYTPDDLVGLIVRETVDPLVQSRLDAFTIEASELTTSSLAEDRKMGRLKQLDPAEKILELKV
ncbi:MAG: restriction endonuclease, partial [Proteobacteria bacterium]|nr:restriction endonuclease [Pseudomonadota bacterium]